MGQYGNQPDFGTKAVMISPTGSAADPASGETFAPGMLYVGGAGNLVVTVVGGNEGGANGTTTFSDVPIGIFPVIVTNVWQTNGPDTTSAAKLVVLY